MIYRTFLQKWQVAQINNALLSNKIKETAVDLCIEEKICSRSAAYIALEPETYDSTKCIHRCALDAAVRLLCIHGVNFDWLDDIHNATLSRAVA